MIFEKMIRKLKEGINISFKNVDITEDFRHEYKEYQERAKKRKNGSDKTH